MKLSDYYNRLAELNADVETAIAKLLMKNKDITTVFDKNICIGNDDNGVRSVFYNNIPIRNNMVEYNLSILEGVEKLVLNQY